MRLNPVMPNRHPFRWLAVGAIMLLVAASLAVASPSRAFTTVPLTPTPGGGSGSPASGSEVTVELPPPDLPTTNEQGYTFDLKASLKADLDKVPKEAPVYELRRSPLSVDAAQALADKLGIGQKVTDRGDGTFEAAGNGQLFVSAELVQYFSPAKTDDGKLPEDQEAVAFARDWLRTAGILPPDLGNGRVVSRIEETKRLIIVFGPAEPADVLAAYPSISVTLGPKGTVTEASLRWASVVRTDIYQLMPARQAWQTVESGQAYIDAELAKANLDPGADVKGRVTFSDIAIAYSTSGPPGGKQYLQPIYVFTGKLKIDDKDGSYVVRAYVPALANSGAPVGFIVGAAAS
jgi:hypothetical protein